jgi:hypothetical protein
MRVIAVGAAGRTAVESLHEHHDYTGVAVIST